MLVLFLIRNLLLVLDKEHKSGVWINNSGKLVPNFRLGAFEAKIDYTQLKTKSVRCFQSSSTRCIVWKWQHLLLELERLDFILLYLDA
jgi:hypothetical protein